MSLPAVRIREVTNAQESDVASYCKILAEAFDYKFFSAALGENRDLQEPMMRAHVAAALAEDGGEVHVAEEKDGSVVGISVWFGSGHVFLDSETQRSVGWYDLMARLDAPLQDWWTNFLVQYNALCEKSLSPGVKLGSYNLQLIGVLPGHQGKGIASRLMRYAEEKAQRAGVPAVVETVGPTNTAIYQALGYNIADSGPITAPPPAGGSFEMMVFIKYN